MNTNIEKTKELALKSKNEKWLKTVFKEDKKRGDMQIELKSSCEFCFDAKWDCSKCLCPEVICSENGFGGLIGYLYEKHSDDMSIPIFYRDARNDFDLIVDALNELIETGRLSGEKIKSLKTIANNS